jgi:hypothetical protein
LEVFFLIADGIAKQQLFSRQLSDVDDTVSGK